MAAASVHYVGVCGAGMSALAQFRAMGGGAATGSDRLLDHGETLSVRKALEALMVKVYPQDGSGLTQATSECVVSTAIEGDNPDLLAAKAKGIPVTHRADALAREVSANETLAVAGTSGKSTVAGMVFEILRAAKKDPSVTTGAGLNVLMRSGFLGNAWRGKGPLVIEADESDGTLPKYAPKFGLVLNVGKDHKEITELQAMFKAFKERCGTCVVNADAPLLKDLQPGALSYGFEAGELRGEGLVFDGRSCGFSVYGVAFSLAHPGRHNAENALAAAALAKAAGVGLETSAAALKRFAGVYRRFESLGVSRGVEVIDDYAHNPDKVRAVLAAAQARAKRVLAVFQPHGFAPTRFLKNEFVAAFAEALRPEDKLWLTDIYYVGGTAAKDVSAADIALPVAARGRSSRHVGDREKAADEMAAEAKAGDLVLVLGARDPSLNAYARGILKRLG